VYSVPLAVRHVEVAPPDGEAARLDVGLLGVEHLQLDDARGSRLIEREYAQPLLIELPLGNLGLVR